MGVVSGFDGADMEWFTCRRIAREPSIDGTARQENPQRA